jgi:hypothetical protein
MRSILQDIKGKFPKEVAKAALNQQVYAAELSQGCEKKALEIMKESGSIYDEISRLLRSGEPAFSPGYSFHLGTGITDVQICE